MRLWLARLTTHRGWIRSHRIPGVIATVACVIASGCSNNPAAPTIPQGPGKPIVDDSPAWSHDGLRIAFHRAFPSSDGPPGVYVVSRFGGPPRLIAAGDYAGPRYLRFSPDDRKLVAMWNLQLVIIDVATGEAAQPFFTDNGATYPDWSPDGKTIAYTRLFLDGYPPELSDSTGIHLFDLASGTDTPLRTSGEVIYGTYPRWSKDGRLLGYLAQHALAVGVNVVRPDGSGLRQLALSPSTEFYDYLQWHSDRLSGEEGLVFRVVGRRYQRPTYWVRLREPGAIRWPMELGPYDTISHDGSEVALVLPEPTDSLPVIFLARADDPTGASRRQLTSWHPAGTAQ